MSAPPKVIVVGLDSVSPELAFDVHRARMPFLTGLRERGVFGPLRSTDPPITVPAWVSMTTGRSPAELGIYGFRGRRPGSYELSLATPADIPFPRIWDLAAGAGLGSVVVSVPLTYPPREHPAIWSTSCFLTPSGSSPYASPAALKPELEARFGPYLVDVDGFRTDDKARLVAGCRALTAQHFAIFRHLVETRSPAFAMLVDLGPDRLHHGALRAALPSHPKHDPGAALTREAADYYALLDAELARTCALAGEETIVLVVSDHGVRPLRGSVCVNEWLLREGYLHLHEAPSSPAPLARCRVDWSRTRAFGEGGYHARVFFNVAGRDPQGIVPRDRLDEERAALAAKACALVGPDGERLATRAFTPAQLYGAGLVRGFPPDLTIYWDDLARRSAGTIGHGALHLPGNDAGPDDANHDLHGIFAMAGGRVAARGRTEDLRVEDVFATAMAALGVAPPAGGAGRSVL
jgi:predicted AlkP superfamily phosphohydrolase/phosphomutase